MDIFRKLTDFLMPLEEPLEDEEPVRHEEAKPAPQATSAPVQSKEEAVEERRVVNGPPATSYVSSAADAPETQAAPPRANRSRRGNANAQQTRPQLTVHETRVPSLDVKIHMPANFDHVPKIADDLRAGQAVLVNYERIEREEQRRICDFVNGVCFIMNGEVRRVSDTMVLYVPAGVNVYEAEPVQGKDKA